MEVIRTSPPVASEHFSAVLQSMLQCSAGFALVQARPARTVVKALSVVALKKAV
jgi:hypothetical protein